MNKLSKTFKGKLVLITGGSSGIGQALARQFVDLGANVYILARKLEHLTATILELKKRRIDPQQIVGLISADVAEEKHIQSIMNKFVIKVGLPDLLVNSAGIVVPGTVTELDTHVFHSIMNVNFFGTVNVTKALLPYMIQRGSGHIVNISSFAGFFASYGYSAYASSKFAVRGFSDVIRAELKPYGIKVSIVFPADTDTPQLAQERKQQSEMMRQINSSAGMMSAEKVAAKIIDGIAKNRYAITPGFEASLAYTLTNLMGYIQYPLMDSMIAEARKKTLHKEK
jgi:3-dehydrosphinganine reductase